MGERRLDAELGRAEDSLPLAQAGGAGDVRPARRVGLQWASCYVLWSRSGSATSASAPRRPSSSRSTSRRVPATPSNLGVFQAACVAVLHGAYGVGSGRALGYGIVLQAVEIATAVADGHSGPAGEGLSWKDVRLRALRVGAGPARADVAAAGQRRRRGLR